MNINKYNKDLLAALGDTSGAKGISEFRAKHVAATITLKAAAVPVASKPQIAALTTVSTANGSDATTTQTLANDLKAKVNAIIAALKA